MIQFFFAHPTETVLCVTAGLNLMAALAGDVKNPTAERIISVMSALFPDIIGALKAALAKGGPK